MRTENSIVNSNLIVVREYSEYENIWLLPMFIAITLWLLRRGLLSLEAQDKANMITYFGLLFYCGKLTINSLLNKIIIHEFDQSLNTFISKIKTTLGTKILYKCCLEEIEDIQLEQRLNNDTKCRISLILRSGTRLTLTKGYYEEDRKTVFLLKEFLDLDNPEICRVII